MSHHNNDFCPNTTPILYVYSYRFSQGVNPRTFTFPRVGTSIPVSILMVVLFPLPFGPMYPTISPSGIVSEIESSAVSFFLVGLTNEKIFLAFSSMVNSLCTCCMTITGFMCGSHILFV